MAVALGYLVGHVGAVGKPPFPPIESTQSLFYLVAVAGIIGVVEVLVPTSVAARWVARIGLVGLLLWLTLRAMLRYHWQTGEATLWLSGLALLALLLWSTLSGLSERVPDLSQQLGWMLSFIGVGIVLILSHSALLGQLAFVVVAALAAIVLVSVLAPASSGLKTAVPVLLTVLAGLLLSGTFYADLPGYRALALALAPVGLVLGELGQPSSRSKLRRVILGCGGVLLLLAPVVLLASLDQLAQTDDGGYSEYEY